MLALSPELPGLGILPRFLPNPVPIRLLMSLCLSSPGRLERPSAMLICRVEPRSSVWRWRLETLKALALLDAR